MTTPLQKTSRLFIAIPLPEFLKDALQECQEWLSSYPEMKEIKDWIEISKMHITLHFLGDVSHQKISQIQEIVSQIAKQAPLTLTMKDIGTFEKNELPYVLWVGILKNEALSDLYEKLAQKLEEIDIEIENTNVENYNPHVTLAYIRTDDETKKAMKERLQKIIVGEIGVWDSNKIELLSSTPTREGSVYKVIS
ncbi:RNA 2',3'-cyclic phosphodiesterase [Bernardetia sp. Wsw4-3y2]|uniref:RNA 2',3'-cyclic phosphodiesterase n=1 Tax=Bernardetia sp. Wsw4-3y2 TaxID=3127471 RepID=UPI0030D0B2BA